MKGKLAQRFIIIIFILLYLVTSFSSTIHVIAFFDLSNSNWLAILLGIAFELGSAASLCSLAILKFTNKFLVWLLFFILTAFQIQSNMWFAYTHIHDYKGWVELFGLDGSTEIIQKRFLSIVSGAILPLVALGFIKSLVDYIRPKSEPEQDVEKPIENFQEYEQESIKPTAELEQTIQNEALPEIDNKKVQNSVSSKPVAISTDTAISRGGINVKIKK